MQHLQSNHKRSLSFNHHLSYNQYSSSNSMLGGTNTLIGQKPAIETMHQMQLREQQAYNAKINSKGEFSRGNEYIEFVVFFVCRILLLPPNPTKFCTYTKKKSFLPLQSTIAANWSIANLRPAPPLRPAIVNTNSTSNAVLTSSKKSQPTYEEDALVLRVIEAYCVAYQNPTRNALHSGSLHSIFFLLCFCNLAEFAFGPHIQSIVIFVFLKFWSNLD